MNEVEKHRDVLSARVTKHFASNMQEVLQRASSTLGSATSSSPWSCRVWLRCSQKRSWRSCRCDAIGTFVSRFALLHNCYALGIAFSLSFIIFSGESCLWQAGNSHFYIQKVNLDVGSFFTSASVPGWATESVNQLQLWRNTEEPDTWANIQ